MRRVKVDLVKLLGGIIALVFLIRGDTLAAVWVLWVITMFRVELS